MASPRRFALRLFVLATAVVGLYAALRAAGLMRAAMQMAALVAVDDAQAHPLGLAVVMALLLALAACGGAGTQAVVPAPPAARLQLGANLPAVYDYTYTPVYTNLVHQARCFGPPDRPWGGDCVPVGPDGWPTGAFGLFLSSVPGQPGRYAVSFSGHATVGLIASADTTLSELTYDEATNRSTLHVLRGPASANLVLTFTDVQRPVKDLKVVRPGYNAVDPPLFTQAFLQHVARFDTLRVMEMLRTNGNPVRRWDDRHTLRTHHATDTGVPWEHIVALANQTGRNLWINIPALADDDYVLRLATLLRTTLQPGRVVWVEYSNELWNPGFVQFAQNRQLALDEVAAQPGVTLDWDGSTNPDVWMVRRTALRGLQISELFRRVYGDDAMMRTIRPVFAGQVVQPHVAALGLDFIARRFGPPSRYFHALAGAPYANLGALQTADGLTPDQVLAAIEASVGELDRSNRFEQNLALARWHGLPFIAYEGGIDTFGPGSIGAKKAAGLDDRMRVLCRAYLDTWSASTGGLMMWFTAGAGNWDTPYGSFELSPDPGLGDSPKSLCLDQALAAAPPPLRARHTVPGSFSAYATVGNVEPFSEASRRAVRYLHPGEELQYLVLADRAGPRSLVLTAAAAAAGNRVDVWVNGERVAAGLALPHQGWTQLLDTPAIAVPLSAGHNVIALRTVAETSGFDLQRLTLR